MSLLVKFVAAGVLAVGLILGAVAQEATKQEKAASKEAKQAAKAERKAAKEAAKAQWQERLDDSWDPAQRATKVTNRMAKVLKLDDKQKTKVQEITQTRLETIRTAISKAKTDGDRAALVKARKDAQEAFLKSMKEVLTPEQQAKFDAMRKDLVEKAKKRGSLKKDEARDAEDGPVEDM